jgi:hypothetical protein
VRVKDGSFQISHPVNLHHKLVDSGESKGELVHTRGALTMGTGPGIDRGGVEWNGVQYRVMGDQLCRVADAGTVTSLGTVGSDGLAVSFAVGFDRIAVRSATTLFYYDGTTLTELTDPDLGPCLDVAWIDSYFISTDGNYTVADDLTNPLRFGPLRYGSAESDPDAITGVDNLNEELVIFGRDTIQFQRNVGGLGYPFETITAANIPYGCISAQAKCRIGPTLAFVGSSHNEPLGVYLIVNGTATRISDEEIDGILADCRDLSAIHLEGRKFGDEQHLVLHAGTTSAGMAMKASEEAGVSLWHRLEGANGGKYRPRNVVYLNGQYWVGDALSNSVGVLEKSLSAQFDEEPGWSFDAGLLNADGKSLIVHEVEISGQFPTTPTALFFSITRDGELWSREIGRRTTGRRDERMVWRPNVNCGPIAGLKFRGFGRVSIARCDAGVEVLG